MTARYSGSTLWIVQPSPQTTIRRPRSAGILPMPPMCRITNENRGREKSEFRKWFPEIAIVDADD
jgi:hypothetical protein